MQPKYSRLKKLHKAIKQCEHVLVSSDPTVRSFGTFQQRWWAENYDKVMELYNVQRFDQQAVPLPTPPISEDDGSSKIESARDSPVTPLTKECLPRHFHHPIGMGYSSDSLEHRHLQSQPCYERSGVASTRNVSNISVPNTERSSIDASVRTSSTEDEDQSDELSISNASDMEIDNSGVSASAERSLEKCMQDYGGKRAVEGYKSNTCNDDCDYNNWPLPQTNRRESFTVVLLYILDHSSSFIPVDSFQVTTTSNLGVQCRYRGTFIKCDSEILVIVRLVNINVLQ